MKLRTYYGRAAAALAVVFLLSACSRPAEETTPTLSPEQIETQAVATYAAELTSTAASMPTETATATATVTATATIAATNTPSGSPTSAGAVPTGSCYSMRYVSDVTIPDNTEMTPGQTFTKTWRVRNNGSCPWDAGFRFRFTGGEAMGGSEITLANAVQPGAETNLSVELTAPTAAGTYRGNWRMATASGQIFGDEVYVLIIVEGTAPTATSAATTAPTATNTTAAPSATPTPTGTPSE